MKNGGMVDDFTAAVSGKPPYRNGLAPGTKHPAPNFSLLTTHFSLLTALQVLVSSCSCRMEWATCQLAEKRIAKSVVEDGLTILVITPRDGIQKIRRNGDPNAPRGRSGILRRAEGPNPPTEDAPRSPPRTVPAILASELLILRDSIPKRLRHRHREQKFKRLLFRRL